MAEINYYEILEVYPAANTTEIETAYRMLLYKYHPDHNPDRGQWAHEMTSKVVEAYQCLANPERRKLYNFTIYCPLKKKVAERKFLFFQGKTKKLWELALAQFGAGVALYSRQKPKALEKFLEALKHWPKFPEALFNQALCLVDLKKYEEARALFLRVKLLLPKDQEIVRTLKRLDDLMKK